MKLVITLVTLYIVLAVVDSRAPLLPSSPKLIPNQYIVVLHEGTTTFNRDLHVTELKARFSHRNERILHVFEIGNLIGFSAWLSKETLAQELEHPSIRYIEADQKVHALESTVTQSDLPAGLWGLDRIDERQWVATNNYTYWESAGSSVYAYVLDTGILITHNEFTGRAIFGFSSISGESNSDENGHGTHIAGTLGGTTFGVAKKVTLVAVKVLSAMGSGTIAGIIAGIDYVTRDHLSRGKDARSVANLSLGGGPSPALDDAIANSIGQGLNFVVAAGGSNADACNYSPSRVEQVITAGATDNTDARSTSSNYGSCVNIFAPGVNILSAWIGSNIATNTISGSSTAAPLVAGAVAVHLGHLAASGKPTPTPAVVQAWISEVATKNLITNPGTGSPNNLLYSPYSDN